ncbi:MAG: bifunctional phosphoribosyl-AMP cyclohydrolase/phosphoribosyl-ATP diphosphatase HisIE [Saprospiraceae bacterium]|nr:bifunctional phosphoribosyl-AMP cyclohydrolase/phosphoribosyl-ATP diphosphatase HisIE [Saprospiraceae bacterium]
MQITLENMDQIDFAKGDGLVPAIIQDRDSGRVLMLGYMDPAALRRTFELQQVTFYSRSKERLWTKGETSGNYLRLDQVELDCDADTLLIQALPQGPVCHTGDPTCFGKSFTGISFLTYLEDVIDQRHSQPSEQSYTSSLFQRGIDKIAQKVGEEAVEVVIASKNEDEDLLLGELADLTYHLLVLLRAKNIKLGDVLKVLEDRHQ